MKKGLEYIELEAHSEADSDDEFHLFDTLDLITNDLDTLKGKITRSAEVDSVENDKEQKTDSVETNKAQKIDASTTPTTSWKQPMHKGKAVQNNNSDETATTNRMHPRRQVKAEAIDAKEQIVSSIVTGQKTNPAEATAVQRCQVEGVGKKLILKKQKH
ncbi:hypothetical protein ACP70R_024860 [Stipagrostis hirtigluma subsp. patula]